MPDSTLGIQVQIRTEADVAAVEKATGSIDKLESELKKVENTTHGVGSASSALNSSFGATAAGTNELLVALGGFGGAAAIVGTFVSTWLSAHKEIAESWENLKKAASDAMADTADSILGDGSAIIHLLDTLTLSIGGQTTEMQKWADHSKTASEDHADAIKASTDKTIAALAREKDAFNDAESAAKEYAATIQMEIDTEKQRQRMDADEEKARIDADPVLSVSEKAARKRGVDQDLRRNIADLEDAAGKKRIDEAKRETDDASAKLQSVAAQRDEQKEKVDELKKLEAARTARKTAETQADNIQRSAPSQVDPATGGLKYFLTPEQQAEKEAADNNARRFKEQEEAARKRISELGGAGTEEAERAKLKRLQEETNSAADRLKKAAQNEGITERKETNAASLRRQSLDSQDRIEADKDRASANKSESDAAAKELDAASGKMKEAASSEDKSTKQLATTLDKLAALIGTKDKAMSAALEQMAQSLSDGASQQEIAKIQNAVNTIAKFQNSTAQDLSAIASGLIDTIQSQAQTLSQTRKEVEALKQKVNSMK